MGDDLLNVKEAAAMVRRPEATMRFWRHVGEGPRSFKMGSRVFYKRSDVLAWIESQYAAQG